jgi:multicomponent Na+:H+ antiporter subunit G
MSYLLALWPNLGGLLDLLSALLLCAGAFFFFAGTLGLLRFPDLYSRLHALTKADNAGLGLVVLGLLLQVDSVAAGAKLVLVWLLVLVSSASVAHLVARAAHQRGVPPWRSRD